MVTPAASKTFILSGGPQPWVLDPSHYFETITPDNPDWVGLKNVKALGASSEYLVGQVTRHTPVRPSNLSSSSMIPTEARYILPSQQSYDGILSRLGSEMSMFTPNEPLLSPMHANVVLPYIIPLAVPNLTTKIDNQSNLCNSQTKYCLELNIYYFCYYCSTRISLRKFNVVKILLKLPL